MNKQTQPLSSNDHAVVKHHDPAIVTLCAIDRMLARTRDRHVEALYECLARKIDHIHDDAEAAQDYCRRLIREGADITDQLKQMECLGNAILLVALMLKRESGSQ